MNPAAIFLVLRLPAAVVLASAVFLGAVLLAPRDAQAKISITYEPTKFPREVRTAAQDLDPIVKYVELNIPSVSSISVVVKDCGEVNAFYDPTERLLTFCYDLVKFLAEKAGNIFSDTANVSSEDVGRAFHHGMFYVFGHEIGHAYDHLSGKDFPGNGEDIADQIATYLMWSVKIDEGSALGGLVFYDVDEANGEEDLWDEHTPDKKRLANLACWSYGANPEEAKDLLAAVGDRIGDTKGMSRRSARCAGEWAKIKRVGDQAVIFRRPDSEISEK